MGTLDEEAQLATHIYTVRAGQGQRGACGLVVMVCGDVWCVENAEERM
jgi:hypothetical protein